MNSMGSKCEWNWSTTVKGTFSKCSKQGNKLISIHFFNSICRLLPIINPTVTSSGKRIRSPILINFPPPATGTIRRASARLMQNPAPPVANQKRTLGSDVFRFFYAEHEIWVNIFGFNLLIISWSLHIPGGSQAGKRHSAFPDTIPLPDCTRWADWPVEAHSHSCRRRSDKTIWEI